LFFSRSAICKIPALAPDATSHYFKISTISCRALSFKQPTHYPGTHLCPMLTQQEIPDSFIQQILLFVPILANVLEPTTVYIVLQVVR